MAKFQSNRSARRKCLIHAANPHLSEGVRLAHLAQAIREKPTSNQSGTLASARRYSGRNFGGAEQEHFFLREPELVNGARPILKTGLLPEVEAPSDRGPLPPYELPAVLRELERIRIAWGGAAAAGVIFDLQNDAERAPLIAEQLKLWRTHDGVEVLLCNVPSQIPATGLSHCRSSKDALDVLGSEPSSLYPVEFPSGGRLLDVFRRPLIGGIHVVRIRPSLITDSDRDVWGAPIGAELQRIGSESRGDTLLLSLPGRALNQEMVEEIEAFAATLRSRSSLLLLHFSEETVYDHLLEDLGLKVHHSIQYALAAAKAASSIPRILPPEKSWRAFSVEYDSTRKGFVLSPGDSDKLEAFDSVVDERFSQDARAVVESIPNSGEKRVLFRVGEMEPQKEFVKACAARLSDPIFRAGGVFVMEAAAPVAAQRLQEAGIVVQPSAPEAYQALRYPVRPPDGGFQSLHYSFVRGGEGIIRVQPMFQTEELDPAVWMHADEEILDIAYANPQGIVLDFGEGGLSDFGYSKLADWASDLASKCKRLGVVSGDGYTRLGLQNEDELAGVGIHRYLDEAVLHVRDKIVPPSSGWELLKLEEFGEYPGTALARMPSPRMCGDLFDGRVDAAAFARELLHLCEQASNVILDVPRLHTTVVDRELSKSLDYMDGILQVRGGNFSLIAPRNTSAEALQDSGTLDTVDMFDSVEEALSQLSRKEWGLPE